MHYLDAEGTTTASTEYLLLKQLVAVIISYRGRTFGGTPSNTTPQPQYRIRRT